MSNVTAPLRDRRASPEPLVRPQPSGADRPGPAPNPAYRELRARVHREILDRVDLARLQRLSAEQIALVRAWVEAHLV